MRAFGCMEGKSRRRGGKKSRQRKRGREETARATRKEESSIWLRVCVVPWSGPSSPSSPFVDIVVYLTLAVKVESKLTTSEWYPLFLARQSVTFTTAVKLVFAIHAFLLYSRRLLDDDYVYRVNLYVRTTIISIISISPKSNLVYYV